MINILKRNSKVTVIIPCYNDGAYIEDAVHSVLNQSYSNYEVIIVDDGSNDINTVRILREMKYQSVKLLYKTNGGVSSARNYGVRHADSDYLLFLDADDIYDRTFLEKGVNILDNQPEIGVVTCYARYFFEKDFNKTIDVWRPQGGGVENFLIENNAVSSSLVRYECWRDAGGYDEDLVSMEDRDFWIKITKNGWLIHTIPEELFHHRRTEKSKGSRYRSKKPHLYKRIVENNEEIYKKYVVYCLYEKEKEVQYYKAKVTEVQDKIRKSLPYVIGYYVTYPYIKIKKLFKAFVVKLIAFFKLILL